MNFYLNKNGQKLGPTEAGQVWGNGWTSWMTVRSETSHQVVIPTAQSHGEPFQRKQGWTLLAGLDHLDVPLGDVRLYCERILTQLRGVTQTMKILPKSLERASGYLVLHWLRMPNQGFA